MRKTKMSLSSKNLIRLTLVFATIACAFSVATLPAQVVKEKVSAKEAAKEAQPDTNSAELQKADVAVPKNSKFEAKVDGKFLKTHKSFNEQIKKGNADLLFIGDSITNGWRIANEKENKNGKKIWDKYYEKRNAVNLGIGGDQTQHVLWRLQNGNLDGPIKPKAAVVMIGTNNASRGFTSEQIAAGITAIVKELRTKLPETKILLLAVFPRGQDPKTEEVKKLREKITKTNEIIKKLDDGKMVTYLDIGPKFLEKDGKLDEKIMYDALHLTTDGYQIWAEAIEGKLAELMGESKNAAKANDDAKLVSVNGKISIDGKPLSQGTVTFVPKQGRVSSGKINADGSFIMTTFQKDDGVLPGEYAVAITSNEIAKDKITKWFIPSRYASAESSGMRFNVTGPTDNFVISLTWKGDNHSGPYLEKSE